MKRIKTKYTFVFFILVLQQILCSVTCFSMLPDFLEQNGLHGDLRLRHTTKIPIAFTRVGVSNLIFPAKTPLRDIAVKISQRREEMGLSPRLPLTLQDEFFEDFSWQIEKERSVETIAIKSGSGLPGKVLHLFVQTGQQVQRGAPLCLLDLGFKREYIISSPDTGEIKKIIINKEQEVIFNSVVMNLLLSPRVWKAVNQSELINHQALLVPFFPWGTGTPRRHVVDPLFPWMHLTPVEIPHVPPLSNAARIPAPAPAPLPVPVHVAVAPLPVPVSTPVSVPIPFPIPLPIAASVPTVMPVHVPARVLDPLPISVPAPVIAPMPIPLPDPVSSSILAPISVPVPAAAPCQMRTLSHKEIICPLPEEKALKPEAVKDVEHKEEIAPKSENKGVVLEKKTAVSLPVFQATPILLPLEGDTGVSVSSSREGASLILTEKQRPQKEGGRFVRHSSIPTMMKNGTYKVPPIIMARCREIPVKMRKQTRSYEENNMAPARSEIFDITGILSSIRRNPGESKDSPASLPKLTHKVLCKGGTTLMPRSIKHLRDPFKFEFEEEFDLSLSRLAKWIRVFLALGVLLISFKAIPYYQVKYDQFKKYYYNIYFLINIRYLHSIDFNKFIMPYGASNRNYITWVRKKAYSKRNSNFCLWAAKKAC